MPKDQNPGMTKIQKITSLKDQMVEISKTVIPKEKIARKVKFWIPGERKWLEGYKSELVTGKYYD